MMDTVLILGANGRLGRPLVDAFAQAGWKVFAHTRRPLTGTVPAGVEPIDLPVTDLATLAAAAAGADVVVHAMNPPYTDWSRAALPLAEAAMNLAERLGALLMLPGNVYNFGSPMPALLTESTAQRPSTRKGAIRERIETAMHARPSLRSVVVRAGDFFGGSGTGSWFDLVIAKDLARGRIVYPGPRELEHAWAYLPDLAQAFVRVAQRREALARFELLHFPGHALSGDTLVAALVGAAQRAGALDAAASVSVGSMPWWLFRAGGLVVPMWRELAEMRYLWTEAHRLSGERLANLVGPVPHTPLDRALDEALAALA